MATPLVLPGPTNTDRARDTVDRDTGQVIGLEQYACSKQIYTENDQAAPFTVLLEKLQFETSWDDTYFWKEDAAVEQSDTLSGTLCAGIAVLNVTNVRQWTIHDTLFIRSHNAQGVVTARDEALGTITVSWQVAPAGALAAGTVIVRMAPAYPQVSYLEIGPTTVPVTVSNIYQDIRKGVGFSDQHALGKWMFNPGDVEHQLNKKKHEYDLESEKTFIMGQAQLDATGTSPRGTLRGLFYSCATNRTPLGAALTRPTLDTFFVNMFDLNEQQDQKWLFLVASRLHTQISQMANALERTDTNASQFGMGISRYKCPSGKVVRILTHPLLTRHWPDIGILVNMSRRNVYGVWHRGLATRKRTSNQPLGRSAREIYYRGVRTLAFKRENVNIAVMTDVAA